VFVMPRPICNYIYIIVLQFYVCFAYLSLMWQVTFSLSHLWFELCNPIVGGQLEVPVTYLGSLGYFLAQGLMLLNVCS
jgi:hypothetical protein